MISGERRECEQHRKEHPAWPPEVAHVSAAFPLAHPGAARTPHRALAAHPALCPSRNTVSSCRRARPTPGVVTAAPTASPPLPQGLAPLPAPSAAQQVKVESWGQGHFGRGCSEEHPPPSPQSDPEASAVAPWGPRQGLLWGLTAACVQDGGSDHHPSPMPIPCSPMVGPRSPGRGTRGPTHIAGAEMDKTHMNGHGRTQGAL